MGNYYILDISKFDKIKFQYPMDSSWRNDSIEVTNRVLNECNPYVQFYKMIHQEICEEQKIVLKKIEMLSIL